MLPQMIAASRGRGRGKRRRSFSIRSASRRAPATGPRGSPAASSSAWRSPALSPIEPKILLADEPTGNLDHATGESVLDTLLDLVRRTGLAALIATHNLDLARRLDRIVALEDGRLRAVTRTR